MFVWKMWKDQRRGGLEIYQWKGWFLFGFIPLILRRETIRAYGD